MRRGAVVRAELVELQGRTEEIRYQKRDDERHYQHDCEQANEMWLVTVGDRRGILIVPSNARIPLWEKE